jgi:hypothetical protein
VALAMFIKGEGGFKGATFIFVSESRTGRPSPVRTATRTLKNSTGKVFGLENFVAAQKPEGQITEDTLASNCA